MPPLLDTWALRATTAVGFLSGIVYNGADLWVSVGDGIKTQSSPDGITWTDRANPLGPNANRSCYGLAYGAGVWVAVVGGNGGTGLADILRSADGTTWTQPTDAFTGACDRALAVTYGNGLFIAAGDNGEITTSPDGTTWTARSSSFGTSSIWSLGWANGQFVAGGDNGKIETSPDGTTWTARTSGAFGSIFSLANDGNGYWVAGTSGAEIRTSLNGVTWTARSNPFTSGIRAISYGGGMWVAGGDHLGDFTADFNQSVNGGITWTAMLGSPITRQIYSVAYNNGLWAVGAGSGQYATSVFIPDRIVQPSYAHGRGAA